MSNYRYVVFPQGKQPTVDEVAEFRNLADVVARKFAIGVCRKSGGLAIAFDASTYEYGMLTHRGFAALIRKWEARGSEVVERLSFVKDATALRPVQQSIRPLANEDKIGAGTSYGKTLAVKEWAAKEAVARSLLGVQQTLDQYALLNRLSIFVPYLLIALAGLVMIGTGFYTYHRLQESGTERRRETTVRVIDDPMNQPLERQRVPAE